jgi:hypothetical protein
MFPRRHAASLSHGVIPVFNRLGSLPVYPLPSLVRHEAIAKAVAAECAAALDEPAFLRVRRQVPHDAADADLSIVADPNPGDLRQVTWRASRTSSAKS